MVERITRVEAIDLSNGLMRLIDVQYSVLPYKTADETLVIIDRSRRLAGQRPRLDSSIGRVARTSPWQ